MLALRGSASRPACISTHARRYVSQRLVHASAASEGASASAIPGAALQDSAIRKMAKELRIHDAGRHIFLCCDQTKAKCCSKEAGLESWDFLKNRIKELGLESQPEKTVWRTKANCLRVCAKGPIAVVYPDKTYYHSCTPEVLEQIIQSHLIKGEVLESHHIKPAA